MKPELSKNHIIMGYSRSYKMLKDEFIFSVYSSSRWLWHVRPFSVRREGWRNKPWGLSLKSRSKYVEKGSKNHISQNSSCSWFKRHAKRGLECTAHSYVIILKCFKGKKVKLEPEELLHFLKMREFQRKVQVSEESTRRESYRRRFTGRRSWYKAGSWHGAMNSGRRRLAFLWQDA